MSILLHPPNNNDIRFALSLLVAPTRRAFLSSLHNRCTAPILLLPVSTAAKRHSPTSVASGTPPPHFSHERSEVGYSPQRISQNHEPDHSHSCLNLFKLICNTNQSYEIGEKSTLIYRRE